MTQTNPAGSPDNSTDSAPDSGTEEARLTEALAELTLEEKVQLLTGRDFWTTWPIERIGLRRMVLSDGPSGVRGEVWDERDPSLNLPSATALGSSWDNDIARRYGAAAAVEARRKGVDIVLGPTINLHRSPLGGRHFECLSEDPVLTADLAAAYVSGVQDNGVAATPKHYIANDSETDRFTVDARVGDRALRELYLLAFEKAITEARAWLVMSSYNSINGVTATENELLETPLSSEWGFDGVVVSDWTAVRSLESASASQDLVMPGPDGPWGKALVDAVVSGDVDEAVVDRKVLRLLRLAQRVGALEGPAGAEPAAPAHVEDGVNFTRAAAAEGTVLLTNDGVLPLRPSALPKVAVIGQNARQARTQGGGSATVVPAKVVAPLEGLRAALPDAEVTYSLGAVVQKGMAELERDAITNPATGGPGALVRFLDADGVELFREDRLATTLFYFGGDAPITSTAVYEVSLTWTPDVTGDVHLGYAAVGHGRVFVDGELRTEETATAVGMDLGAALLSPPAVTTPVSVTAGTPVDVRIEFDMSSREGLPGLDGIFGIIVGTTPDESDPDGLIADAVRSATAADLAVVVVGTSSQVESEGFDRTDLALPGRQDDLVAAVAATGTPTVVVVNSGSPVLLPWREEVAAVVVTYFGGQEMGNALADVLLGAVEPGGRLPTTWPAAEQDVPVLSTTPVDGVLDYAEGSHVGYRAWPRPQATEGAAPAYWFGHGLGYTEIALGDLEVPAEVEGDTLRVSVEAHNRGERDGKQVVQVYAERPDSAVDRPVRWLVGFAPVRVGAGERARVEVPVSTRLLAHWADGWELEPGDYTLKVGTSVVDLPLETTVRMAAGVAGGEGR